MERKRITDTLQKAFAEIGAEMKKDSCGLFIVKHDSMEYFIELDEKDDVFCIMQIVMSLNGSLTKNEFDTILNVVKDFYKDYNGEWNGGQSYVYSPWYSIKGVNGNILKKIIKDFFDVWSFACANACILTDASVWK